MVYVIQVCWQLAPDPARCPSVSKPVWHIPLLFVQWKTSNDGQSNCPKHVEFYSQNKFEKLVHLVGFIIKTSFFISDERSKALKLWNCWRLLKALFNSSTLSIAFRYFTCRLLLIKERHFLPIAHSTILFVVHSNAVTISRSSKFYRKRFITVNLPPFCLRITKN